MAPFLRITEVLDFDIIAIQEPWPNPYSPTTHYPNRDRYVLLYPKPIECDRIPRVYFFAHRRLNPESLDLYVESRDVIILEIALKSPNESRNYTLRIHNVYNEPKTVPATALIILSNTLSDDGRFIDSTD